MFGGWFGQQRPDRFPNPSPNRAHFRDHQNPTQPRGQFRGGPRWGSDHRRQFPQHRQSDIGSDFSQPSQEFWCETCDRGFKSRHMLEAHISEHQKCGIDGCKFVGHPNVVTKHIQMQHSSGLYSKIRHLETPEDIAKWIQERKKNYPTLQNLQIKKNQQRALIDRGEKIQNRNSKFNNRNNNRKDRFDNRQNNKFERRRNFDRNKHKFQQKNDTKLPERNKIEENKQPKIATEDGVPYCGVAPFRGISEIMKNDIIAHDKDPSSRQIDIEDVEWQDCSHYPNKDKTEGGLKALSSLLDAYKSFSEDETDDRTQENHTGPFPSENTSNKKETIESNDDDSAPEEVAVRREDTEKIPCDNPNESNEGDNRKSRKRNPPNISQNSNVNMEINTNLKKPRIHPKSTFERQLQYYKERPSTLLEKLLEREIKHERNVVLQCINYVVKNNFFCDDAINES